MNWAILLHIYQPPHWDPRIIGRVVEESYRPILDILTVNPKIRLTLNINASLTEQLAALGYQDVIEHIKKLAEAGQIEFTGSAKYHPILPLLPLDEAERQIKLNSETNRAVFGPVYKPRGFFPPELAVNQTVVDLVKRLGYQWIALDEISASGRIGLVDFAKGYRLKSGGLASVFRNRQISDYLSFVAPPDNPSAFFDSLPVPLPKDFCLVTAFDGENLGHHRPGTDRLWGQLVTDPRVTTLNFSQLVDERGSVEDIELTASSWSTRESDLERQSPFPLWRDADNPIHALQWSLTDLVINAFRRLDRKQSAALAETRHFLDEALSSDQYWWASATPWWSVEIVTQGACRLEAVLEKLGEAPAGVRAKAKRLADSIVAQTREWQENGEAQRRREKFFRESQQVKYLGGQRIDAV